MNQDLVGTLAQLLAGHPTSVEILPGGLKEWTNPGDTASPQPDFPFLHVEGNLGIPQKVLYQIYLLALPVFARTRSNADEQDLAIQSSAVILLGNPAYQTALNFRKRLVEGGRISPMDDLRLSESLLFCCKESVKSSILWCYRRWLLSRIHPAQIQHRSALDNDIDTPLLAPFPENATFSLSPSVAADELALARRACDVYPRNYHAWSHWRAVMENVCLSLADCDTDGAVLQSEYEAMHQWIDLHVSDFSSMYHFCWLHRTLRGLVAALLLRDDRTLVNQAKTLILSYPLRESVWLYLREALSPPVADAAAVREAISWMQANGLSKNSHAGKFLAWGDRFLCT